MMRKTQRLRLSLCATLIFAATACSPGGDWYRGNTHTHSLWSDGDAAPEVVVAWYKANGYDWLSLTDHNTLLQGDRWYPISDDGLLSPARLQEIRDTFGEETIDTREVDSVLEMRLKTLEELRDRFEVPDKFLLIEGEEITDRSDGKPVHFNVLNPAEFLPTQGGETVDETVERTLDAVNGQAERTGRNMLVHLNHPNYGWALNPEQIALMEGTHLFEVYNGSTECNNDGDATHASMDEAWDLANMIRLTQLGLGPLYGVANDDTHNYFEWSSNQSNPGRGWIMVRADSLSTDAILNAIRAGDFYSSTGVELKDVRTDPEEYVVKIAAQRGVSYTTQFIGTRIAHGIPGETGVVLHETTDTKAIYRFRGDELYVRAKVISSRMQQNPIEATEVPEIAWTQPVVPEIEQ